MSTSIATWWKDGASRTRMIGKFAADHQQGLFFFPSQGYWYPLKILFTFYNIITGIVLMIILKLFSSILNKMNLYSSPWNCQSNLKYFREGCSLWVFFKLKIIIEANFSFLWLNFKNRLLFHHLTIFKNLCGLVSNPGIIPTTEYIDWG